MSHKEAEISRDAGMTNLVINGCVFPHAFELQLMRSLINRNPEAARLFLESPGAEVGQSDVDGRHASSLDRQGWMA